MKLAKVMLLIYMVLNDVNVQAAVKQFPLYVERYTDLGGGQLFYEMGTLSEKGNLTPLPENNEDIDIPVSDVNTNTLAEFGISAETLAAISGKIVAFSDDFKAASKKYSNRIVRSAETYVIGDFSFVVVGLEPKIKLSAIDPTTSETAGDTGQFLFSLNTPTLKDIRVKFSVAGTATKGVDYDKFTNYILIPAGNISGIIEVLPIDDFRREGTEKVSLKLLPNGIKGYSIGRQTNATVKILDND